MKLPAGWRMIERGMYVHESGAAVKALRHDWIAFKPNGGTHCLKTRKAAMAIATWALDKQQEQASNDAAR